MTPQQLALDVDAPVTRGASRTSDPWVSRIAGRSMSGTVLRDQQTLVMTQHSDEKATVDYYGVRPVALAQASTSGQFQAGLPPTVQRGPGMTPLCRQMSTVGRLTPSRSATSAMPTGSHSSTPTTVTKGLTEGKVCVDNHYMNTTTKCTACQVDEKRANGVEVSVSELSQWSLWGCTCDPTVAAEAIEWMDRVTR